MERIDHFDIIELLGKGAMGDVYKAQDTRLGRVVAIKMLNQQHSCREDTVKRFIQEAGILANLNHPNIAQVYELGCFEEQNYMVMAFVPGETLEKKIGSQKLSWQKALHFTIGALQGLAHAHQNDVIHRDLKPSNMVVKNDDTLVLLDFGISRILQTERLTAEGQTIGTPEYMSPEQHLGNEGDARSDFYAIGTILYEVLTGQVPFTGKQYTLTKAIVEQKPAPLRTLDSNIAKPLEKLVLKALEKNPEKRFASAQEFIQALTDCRTQIEAHDKPIAKSSFLKSRFFFNQENSQPSLPENPEAKPDPGGNPTRFSGDEPEPIVNSPDTASNQKAANTRRSYPLVVLLSTLFVAVGAGYFALYSGTQSDQGNKADNGTEKNENRSSPTSPGETVVITAPPKPAIPAAPPKPSKTWQEIIKQPLDTLPQQLPAEDLVTLKNAATAGNADVQFYLATMYTAGKGVAKDDNLAFKWYQAAATKEHVEGEYHTGLMLTQSIDTAKDVDQGIIFLSKAARQNHYEAQILLGKIYLEGKITPQNNEEAQQWVEAAAKEGNPENQYDLGHLYLAGKIEAEDPKQARYWFEQAANQGLAKAQYNAGFMAEAGLGGDKDTQKAGDWYEQAAKQGYARAQYSLAVMLCNPKCSTLKTHKAALHWLQKAADQNLPKALHGLADYYRTGIPGLVGKDIQKARTLEQQATKAEVK